jgi:polar amino acid transport system substrate-binding protein
VSDPTELLQRRLERERAARKQAERMLEAKSLETYQANARLRQLAEEQAASLRALRGVAASLRENLGLPPIDDDHAGLTELAQVVIEMSRDRDRLRLDAQRRLAALDQHTIVSIADREGRIVHANDRLCEISGYSREELIGRTHAVFKSGLHPPEFYAELWRTVLSGETWQGELCNRARYDSLYWLSTTIVPFPDGDGVPEQFISVSTDITRQKTMQEEVRGSRLFLQSMTESMGEGVYALDKSGYCSFLNPEAERLLGWSLMELSMSPLHEVAQLTDTVGNPLFGIDDIAHEVLRTQRPYRSEYDTFTDRDGRIFPITINLVPMIQDQEAVGVVAIFQDITDRQDSESRLREATRRAEEASQAKSGFLANVSHEIRTPMNAIIGLSHLALQTELTPRQRDYVEKVHRSGESLLALLNDILDFSKIEAGRLDIESVEFSLQEVLDDLGGVLGYKAEEKGLALLFDVPREVPRHLVGDPLRLRQILLNLCNNALKFTEEGEVVLSVRTERSDAGAAHLRFSVRDTGIGISPDQRERLFQSFSQADIGTTRRYGGTGLGLAISKRLVELMGGRIEVESAPGMGSTFSVAIPFGLATVAEGRREQATIEFTGLRCLVVEDSVSARIIFTTLLQELGVEVDTASNSFVASARLAGAEIEPARGYDFILLDWHLPGVDGVTFLEERLLAGRSTPPVIMATAQGVEALHPEIERRIPGQVLGTLAKPVTGGKLEQLLHRLVGGETPDPHDMAEARTGALRGARVLLVEDNALNQEVASALLEQHGIEVEIAGNGAEALQRLVPGRYDAVLMDCQMPVMDGYEATRAIRGMEDFAELPVIAMTASVRQTDVNDALAAGMDDHIPKPIDVRQMLRTLARWIDREGLAPQALPPGGPDLRAAPTLPPGDTVDAQEGLRNAGGDGALYRRLLQRFATDQAGTAALAREAAAQGDLAGARRILHTLKGTAATIGARALAGLAESAELALETDGAWSPDIDWDGLIRALDEVVSALDQSLPEAVPASPGSTPGLAPGAELRTLLAQLEDYDTAAADTLERMLAGAAPGPLQSALRSARKAIQQYDFAAALEALAGVEKTG